MDKNKIWIGEKDLTMAKDFVENSQKEFQSNPAIENAKLAEGAMQLGGDRRDFLKMLGFGLGAATMAAGCDIPVKRAIPYVVKPDSIIPGVATYYASTFIEGGIAEPILVKTREGRPIHVEGNSMITGHSGVSPRAQASVLSLYNTNRFRTPQLNGAEGFTNASWDKLDARMADALKGARNIRVITNSTASPFAKSAMNAFKNKYPNASIVSYDSVSAAGLLSANEMCFGSKIVPAYHFDKADVIVSFDADFLGAWLGGGYQADYAKGRKVADVNNPKMSRHIQVECHMSLTGSNSDNRILVKPSEQGAAIAALASEIVGGVSGPKLNAKATKAIKKVAAQLKAAGSKALVVSGSNNTYEQVLINAINNALGAYGNTISLSGAKTSFTGDERDIETLLNELPSNNIDVVIFNQCNPLYDSPNAAKLKAALSKVKTKVALSFSPNETSAICDVIAPVNHFLESWGDADLGGGAKSIVQPTISKLFDTRQSEESLMRWSGIAIDGDDYALGAMKKAWKNNIFPTQSNFVSFQGFWDSVLHDGGFKGTSKSYSFSAPSLAGISGKITKPSNAELEIKFFESAHMGNGSGSENPWLMEMPDPVTRTSWGNYLAVPVNFDGVRTMLGYNDLKDGDLVDLKVKDVTYRIPVVQQFGQMKGTVALALGYGRSNGGPVGTNVGADVNSVLTLEKGHIQYYNTNVSVSKKVGTEENFSCVQYHHTFGIKGQDTETGETINADEAALVSVTYGVVKQGYQGSLTDRSVVYNTSVGELKNSIARLKEKRAEAQHLNENTMYPFDEYTETKYSQGHHWGMHVDLNACTGCGACTIACMSENNVPVVGKREVSRHHEMTWLRIDRYFYGEVENPNTVYQPMMCQHCDNAPCENVCPVNATNHSSEGLNQMTYNRCVGTRYCANNCPYKVRRFNWLDYTTADIFPANQVGLGLDTEVPFYGDNLTRMVLNPDVTVRSRGVIEKCSFCVQKIQAGKLTAKVEGRRLQDTDVTSACASACPSGAITFGDMNNKKGDLSKKLHSDLNYIALEEVNVKSSVTYTMKVNNRDASLDA